MGDTRVRRLEEGSEIIKEWCEGEREREGGKGYHEREEKRRDKGKVEGRKGEREGGRRRRRR